MCLVDTEITAKKYILSCLMAMFGRCSTAFFTKIQASLGAYNKANSAQHGRGKCIVGIIGILHLHQNLMYDERCLQNSVQYHWVRVLPLYNFVKKKKILFFGNLHFEHIIAT